MWKLLSFLDNFFIFSPFCDTLGTIFATFVIKIALLNLLNWRFLSIFIAFYWNRSFMFWGQSAEKWLFNPQTYLFISIFA